MMRIWIHKEALQKENLDILGGSLLTEQPCNKFSDRYLVFDEFVEPDGGWLTAELNARPDTWQDYLVNLNNAGSLDRHTLRTHPPNCEPQYELEVDRCGYKMAYLKANDSTPWVYIGYGICGNSGGV